MNRSVAISAALCAAFAGSAGAESFVGSNVDTRLTLAFDVSDEAAQAWLPEGWSLTQFPGGPLAGSDLLVIFIDRHVNLDPEDKPSDHPHYRGVALVSPATRGDEMRLYVTRVYITDAEVNPYSNSIAAEIGRKATLEGSGNAPPSRSEEWSVEDEAGGTISFRLVHAGGPPGFAALEALPYSNVEPDFHRIYRYEQVADLVKSAPAGVDRVEDVSFTTTIEELMPMFDGSEEMLAIISVPWYLRHTYLP